MFIVIPAYNEAKNIGRVISGLFEHSPFSRLDDEWSGKLEIVVIDDGSSDNTGEIAKKAGAMVLRHKINRGQGAALRTGNEYAIRQGAELVVHFDGDDQFNPADINPALAVMKETGADAVLGSRFLDKRSRIPVLKKYFILPLARWMNYLFTGVKLTDAHNGFRILRRTALSRINIVQDRMAHNTEIVRQIKKFGLKFTEVPVEVKYHNYGQTGLGGGVKIIKDLIIGKF